jgi:hypothetical protein
MSEEDSKYLELDGLERNMAKFKMGIKALKEMPDGSPKDWLKAPWNVHHYVDMFVESSRAAPYLMGHVWAVYVPLSIIIGVVGWIL